MGHILFDMAQMRFGVHAQNLLARAARRGFAGQGLEPFMLQNPLDHAHTVRPFGVAGAHIMAEAIVMGEDERVQRRALS